MDKRKYGGVLVIRIPFEINPQEETAFMVSLVLSLEQTCREHKLGIKEAIIEDDGQ